MKKKTNRVHAAPATAQPVKGKQDSITYRYKKKCLQHSKFLS
jgi:hypothetical protein